MSNFNDLIEIVGCDNPDRWGDVIFVHGLGGHARGTWHPQEKHDDDNFWPAWLGNDLKDIGIWSLGYEVEPFKWKGNSMPLTDRATNILDLLDSYGIGERPIIFITHSLGGLLVKQMLRNARDYGEWNAIASQTKGIVFLSTPHSGSDMASWIKHIRGILRTTVSVEELEAHHSRLRELNLLYRNDEQFSQIPMLIYCETRPTGPILVVNQTSADPGIKGVIPIPMDFDHISICKVADKKSQIYRKVKQFIEKNLTTPLAPIPLKLAKGEAIPQEIDRSQPQADDSMRQTNQGDANLAKREPPSLLPYLPNRSDQEFELGQAFQKSLKQAPPHPLVCIIHGNEWQSHDKFLERLQKLSIPRLLALDPSQTKIKEYLLKWPSGSRNLNNLAALLRKELADSVLNSSVCSLKKINEAFYSYPDPIIVHIHLLTRDWQQEPEVLNKLLEFWQGWPHLLPGQRLIVCLFIKYEIKRQRSPKGVSLTWLLGCLRVFLRRWQYERINATIQQQIEALEASNCKQFDRLSVIVLPQLSGISRTHVEDWARSEETKDFLKNFGGEAMIRRLINAIGKMFDSWEEKTSSNVIPMDDLADNLIDLLKSLVMAEGGVK